VRLCFVDAVHCTAYVRPQLDEKSFVMRGISFIISNVNDTDWTVTPAYNVTCGDAPGGPSRAPDAVKAGIERTFIPRWGTRALTTMRKRYNCYINAPLAAAPS
jgi:hypothetical protein